MGQCRVIWTEFNILVVFLPENNFHFANSILEIEVLEFRLVKLWRNLSKYREY